MASKSTASQFQGVSNTFVWTDKAVWLIGSNVNKKERIATIGTLSPMSVVEWEGTFYFLSSDRRWLALTPGESLRDIGADIQDKLNSIPGASDSATSRLYRVAGGASDRRVFLAFGTSGSTNTYVAVYDTIENRIESIDEPTTPFTVEQFVQWVNTGVKGLYAFSSDLEYYQYSQPASSANVTVSFSTMEFTHGPGRRIAASRPFIRCEDMAVTATASVSYYPGTGTARTATLSLDVSTDRLGKYFGAWSSTGDKMGTSAKMTYSATCPGGKYIFALGTGVEDRGPAAGG